MIDTILLKRILLLFSKVTFFLVKLLCEENVFFEHFEQNVFIMFWHFDPHNMTENLSNVLFRFQNLLDCDALEVAPSKNREERVSLTREERAEMRLSRKYPVDRVMMRQIQLKTLTVLIVVVNFKCFNSNIIYYLAK